MVKELSKLYGKFERKVSTPYLLSKILSWRATISIYRKSTQLFINDYLPIEFKDSLYYIERTLAEPSLYSLNGLIEWKESAEDKIDKIQNQLKPKLTKQIENIIVKRYESLRKQLKAEILKMRTYPIPEPWCSYLMKEGLTHMIEGEFIFYVNPEIEEDMEPLNQSERDLLPGGITRQEYDTRMNRLNMEYAIARDTLETRNADEIESEMQRDGGLVC